MNATIGWALAAAAFAVGWWSYGWQGLVMALTVIAFWLLLQFSRVMRAMKTAGESPVGHVASAVMLHAKLKPGMTMVQVLPVTRSLGQRVSETPEVWAWTDDGDTRVEVVFENGRCTRWSLIRPPEEPPAPEPV